MKVIIFKELPKHEFSDSTKTNEKASRFKPTFRPLKGGTADSLYKKKERMV